MQPTETHCIKKRFLELISNNLKSENCRVLHSCNLPDEEIADHRFTFNLVETLTICGASRVEIKMIQDDGFSSIQAVAYENEDITRFNIEQRRQSSWAEYDRAPKELKYKKIDDVICIAEARRIEGKTQVSLKWDSFISGEQRFHFLGKVRAWNKEFFISPICDKESRLYLSESDSKLLQVRSLWGVPTCEGMIHSRTWRLPDNRIQGYDERLLSSLFKEEGLTLIGIHISKGTFPIVTDNLTSEEIKSLSPTYLLAEAIAFKTEEDPEFIEHKYAIFNFMARYSGTEEEWKRMENTTASDLIIRCSFKPWRGENELSYYSPLWIAAIYGADTIYLSGDRIDYDGLRQESIRISNSREKTYATSWPELGIDEIDWNNIL